jgi:hypothetical protein
MQYDLQWSRQAVDPSDLVSIHPYLQSKADSLAVNTKRWDYLASNTRVSDPHIQ